MNPRISARLPLSPPRNLPAPLKCMSRQSPKRSSYTPTYFSPREFETCTPGCDISQMDSRFLEKLDKLREYCGFPLMLTCAYRSAEYDLKKGRSGTSFHCIGRAVDIYCTDSHKRFEIVHNAIYCGLNGIGIGKNFIHVDDRIFATMWHYY